MGNPISSDYGELLETSGEHRVDLGRGDAESRPRLGAPEDRTLLAAEAEAGAEAAAPAERTLKRTRRKGENV